MPITKNNIKHSVVHCYFLLTFLFKRRENCHFLQYCLSLCPKSSFKTDKWMPTYLVRVNLLTLIFKERIILIGFFCVSYSTFRPLDFPFTLFLVSLFIMMVNISAHLWMNIPYGDHLEYAEVGPFLFWYEHS